MYIAHRVPPSQGPISQILPPVEARILKRTKSSSSPSRHRNSSIPSHSTRLVDCHAAAARSPAAVASTLPSPLAPPQHARRTMPISVDAAASSSSPVQGAAPPRASLWLGSRRELVWSGGGGGGTRLIYLDCFKICVSCQMARNQDRIGP